MSSVNRRYFESLMADRRMSLRALAQKMVMGHSQLSLTFSGTRRPQLDEAGVRRCYLNGSHNLVGPYAVQNVALEWASPILIARP